MPSYVLNAISKQVLNLIILPTEKCNFRCTYCYEDYKIGKMHRSVINGIKALISHRLKDLSILEISWFGGEPLLATDVIEEISQDIQSLNNLSPDCIYNGSICTNGYLLNLSRWTKLVELGITQYQISLDGDKEIHNTTRRFADQSGTFEEIWNNICEFQKSELQAQVNLRIHFTPSSYQSLDPLIGKINTQLGDDPRFKVYFKAIERLGSPNDEKIQTFPDAEKERISSRLYNKLFTKELIFEDEPVSVCYASKANSFVIRANGDIAKCTVALNDAINRVGHLNEDGSIQIDNEHFRLWLTGLETKDEATLACPYGKIKQLHNSN